MENELNFPQDDQGEKRTFAEKLNWLFKGFVYPLWSRPFYKEAAGKRLGTALVFLLIFALLQTIITTTIIAFNLSSFGREIESAYSSGEIPDIRIENGVASASGSGRYLIENNRQVFGVDTTGTTTQIDTSQYSEGLLLTRTEIHLVNEDGYQVIPLTEVNQTLGDPIVLDGSNVTRLWYGISVFVDLAMLVGGFLFFSAGRFVYLVLLGLVVWGASSLSKKGVDFAPVLITGIYANVPTTYLMFVLRKIGIAFFGLRAVILFIIWGIAIAYFLKESGEAPSAEPEPDGSL